MSQSGVPHAGATVGDGIMSQSGVPHAGAAVGGEVSLVGDGVGLHDGVSLSTGASSVGDGVVSQSLHSTIVGGGTGSSLSSFMGLGVGSTNTMVAGVRSSSSFLFLLRRFLSRWRRPSRSAVTRRSPPPPPPED